MTTSPELLKPIVRCFDDEAMPPALLELRAEFSVFDYVVSFPSFTSYDHRAL